MYDDRMIDQLLFLQLFFFFSAFFFAHSNFSSYFCSQSRNECVIQDIKRKYDSYRFRKRN